MRGVEKRTRRHLLGIVRWKVKRKRSKENLLTSRVPGQFINITGYRGNMWSIGFILKSPTKSIYHSTERCLRSQYSHEITIDRNCEEISHFRGFTPTSSSPWESFFCQPICPRLIAIVFSTTGSVKSLRYSLTVDKPERWSWILTKIVVLLWECGYHCLEGCEHRPFTGAAPIRQRR